MKKVVLFLVLVGMAAGLAQAQGVQVRKVFEHKVDNYVTSLSVDTLHGKPIVTADMAYSYKIGGVGSRIAVFDSTGEILTLPGGGSGFPGWARRVSKNGRYFASRQAGGVWKTMDTKGKVLLSFSQSVTQVLQVSEDGTRWLAVRRHPRVSGGRDAPRVANVEDDATDTLVLFNGKGQVLAAIPAPGVELAEFSPKDNWLFLRYKNISGKGYPLACYDQNGKRRWYKEDNVSLPLFRADSLNNLCVLEMRGESYGLAFYSSSGKEEAFVQLVGPPDRIQFAACELELTWDGKYAVFNGDRLGLFYVQKSPSKILWKWKQDLAPGAQQLISGMAVSANGEYIVADVRDISHREGHFYLFNREGKITWKNPDVQKSLPFLSFCFNRYFVAFTGNVDDHAVTLFEVKP